MKTEFKYVLVVDDNLDNLRVTASILKEQKYLISLAQSGEEALEQMEKEAPSIILLDIMMPIMDGLELCRIIKSKEKWKDIPVIFLTAKNQTSDLVEGFLAGGVDYITKPFEREELLMRLKNHLELRAARQEIIEMNRVRDKLYSIIAHDIRSPLSNILQTIDAVEQGYIKTESPAFPEIINDLKQRTRDTLTLLTNLLEWTSTLSTRMRLHPETINLNSLLTECVGILKGNAELKKISIDINIPANESIWCDEVTIHTVFRNLISNAIKFTPVKGEIKIYSKRDQKNLSVFVSDNGIGMLPEVVEKIFRKDDHHTTRGTQNEKGTGLGFIIIKDFLKKNKGILAVESTPGKGTTFKITLPAAP
jgi:two-component system, sensor histidine kinase and response regulator